MLPRLIKIVKKAARIALSYYGNPRKSDLRFKSEKDIVTKADLEVQHFIKKRLKRVFPQAGFLGEEEDSSNEPAQGKYFILDPIDGTLNFSRKFPFYALSLAYEENGHTKTGIVYAPSLNLLYTAEQGRGAYCNRKPIRVSEIENLNKALAATGFACISRNFKPDSLPLFNSLIYDIQEVRRFGSAALDLCMVADGRLDLYWESNLNIWDIAAGVLIVREAGGRVSDYNGKAGYLAKRQVVAGNPKIHAAFLKRISA